MLNELISREDCAKCKICCKFEEDELIDAPTFTQSQINYINNEIDSKINFQKKGDVYQIELIPYQSKYKCPLLSDCGCVLPDKYRPFDCESWPFYVMQTVDKYIITKSDECPSFNQIKDSVLIRFIEKHFLKTAKKIIEKYPNMVTNYNRNLKILYEWNKEK